MAISQTLNLPPQFRFHASSRERHSIRRASVRCLRSRSEPGLLSRTIRVQSQQKRVCKVIGARAVSDSKASTLIGESAGKAIEIQPDTSGGDGFGGADDIGQGGGGGGGGGGDSGSNKGEGGSNESNGDSNKKMAMSMSQKLTLAYAALVGVGGIMGYLKSGSQKSLMAGGLSTLLLYYVYTELPKRPAFASSLGLGLSAALLGVMGSRFKKSGKIFPAGVVSFVSLVMSGGYLHGILRSLH
uniref:Putative glycine-rich RNA-binding protein 7 n=1 Tax=Davidia involucrata TaxID=16924 RepID=A0A5B7BQA2_DAVIN